MGIATEMELSLRDEYEGAELGDHRRTKRLGDMVDTIAQNPDASLPALFPEAAAREGAYRLLRNPKVTPAAMLAPHKEKTAARAVQAGAVVVAHDTTEVDFGRKPRQGLGTIGRGKRYGFYAHLSLAIEWGADRLPLGVVALQTHHRQGKRKRPTDRPGRRQQQRDPENESRRWLRGVQKAAAVLADCPTVIHVMDREADAYPLLAALQDQGERHVVRSCHNRRLADAEQTKLREAMAEAPVHAQTRTIRISRRDASPWPGRDSKYPPRKAREATVAVRATTVTLERPESSELCPQRTLTVHAVQVFEPQPPPGEPAVEWLLLTTEPIDTTEQVWAIVDIYQQRWLIEEYFKALKTGCAYESRQFETEANLLRVLALFAPMAWWLLVLRTLSRADPERPAHTLLSPLQGHCLRAALRRIRVTLPAAPTVRDVLLGIARLGGHIPRNGEPGWIVLMRGLNKLLLMAEGYQLARGKKM